MAALGSERGFVSWFWKSEVNVEEMKTPETETIAIRMRTVIARPRRSSRFFPSRTLCLTPRGFGFFFSFT